ncbi:lipid A-modifier LpxR family protein [Marivivens marinus]|uniref:lipid A-modifier LpxR family protein n=1 Tax=Marivivens marinus TaxID=3110173 RepID=UPI003B848C2C
MRFYWLIGAVGIALGGAHPATTLDLSFGLERETLGVGRLFNNDQFGDTYDRWRTGSYVFSLVRGPDWSGDLPGAPGEIIEYRFRSEIIAPSRLNGPGSDDRPYVGALSVGAHTHFTLGQAEASIGADLTAVGPQTRVSDLQAAFHDMFSLPSLSNAVVDNQIADAFYFSGTAELSWPLHLSETTVLRPFVEAQAGVEDMVRIGGDIMLGEAGQGGLWLRDVPTGQLYPGITPLAQGATYVLGMDYAIVGQSRYLPEDAGVTALPDRLRVRAMAHWQLGPEVSWGYGLTYLSEEFEGQPEGQFVGSVKLNFNF